MAEHIFIKEKNNTYLSKGHKIPRSSKPKELGLEKLSKFQFDVIKVS